MSVADRRDLRRPKTLSRSISRQCHCSKRSIYLLDPHYSLPTDDDINAFLDQYSLRYSHWVEDMHDCDDIAREYWCHAKTWFWTQRQQNVAFGFLLRASTSTQKAHALNFYVRPDMFLRFLDRGERVPLCGRAYLVLI
jgi:hypothetical protein